MDYRDIYHVTAFLFGLRYATIELCFLCVVRAEGIWENTGMEIIYIITNDLLMQAVTLTDFDFGLSKIRSQVPRD
jgi:hypothetical protein